MGPEGGTSLAVKVSGALLSLPSGHIRIWMGSLLWADRLHGFGRPKLTCGLTMISVLVQYPMMTVQGSAWPLV